MDCPGRCIRELIIYFTSPFHYFTLQNAGFFISQNFGIITYDETIRITNQV